VTSGPQASSGHRPRQPARVARALALAEIRPSKLGAVRSARLSSGERELYFWILRHFATSGRPSGTETREEAVRLGLEIEGAFAALQREDLVHRAPDGAITVAYPFSGTPTAHRVRFPDGHEVSAMCAIDALGIAPMFDERVEITSRDPLTGEEIAVDLAPDGAGGCVPEEAVALCGASGRGTSSASCCPFLNFFTSTANAERWLAAYPDVQGSVISLPDAIVAGRAVFGDILKEA